LGLDWFLIALFVVGSAVGVAGAARWGRWAPLATIALSAALGIRALYLLEAGSTALAGLQGALFVLGLLAVRVSMARTRAG